MAKTKSPMRAGSKAASKKQAGKSKSTAAVRDIKPKKAKPAFTIQNVKSFETDAPKVDPLRDDQDDFEENDFEMNKMDIDYDDQEDTEEDYDSVSSYEPSRSPSMRVAQLSDDVDELEENDIEEPMEELLPRDIIKVRFGTFVQLVANHDLAEVIERNANQEIVMSSNLLTELAGAKDEREEKKIPLVFLVGIAIGVVLTYIFFST